MLKQTTSKKQGDVGLGSAIAFFATKGWTVLIPLTDSQNYDLVVDTGIKLEKIQVKTSYRRISTGFEVSLRTMGGVRGSIVKFFDPNVVDALFILTNDGDRYYIPTTGMLNTSSITVGNKYKEYKI